MAIDKETVMKYSLIGAGAILGIIILRRLTAPKAEDDKQLVESAQTATPVGVNLLTVTYTPEQAARFKAALPARGQQYAELFVASGAKHSVPPVILAALMQQESGFGSGCKDAACKGFAGHDYGLMQINENAHPVFFASKVNGRPAYEDPAASVDYGAKVLREAWTFFSRQTKSGQYEVSAANAVKFAPCSPGKHDDPRPLSGESQLVAAIASYNAGAGNAIQALACGLSADAATYGRSYVKNVLGYARDILSRM